MKRYITGILLFFTTFIVSGADYDEYHIGKNISWSKDAFELTVEFNKNINVVWLGKVVDVNVYRNDDGNTTIEYFCEQYRFYKSGPESLIEPFVVHNDPKGYFVVVINIALPVETAKQKILGENIVQKWALVSGHGDFVGNFKGKKAVYFKPKSYQAIISAELTINYLSENEANHEN